MSLKSLEEHNSRYRFSMSSNSSGISFNKYWIKNGIACPKCGEELFDTVPNPLSQIQEPISMIYIECLEEACKYYGARYP